MDLIVLKNFISKLGFVFERSRNSFGYNIEINVENMDDKTQIITGTVDMTIGSGESEVITFTSMLIQSNERLKFESNYRVTSVKTKFNSQIEGQDKEIIKTVSEEFQADDVFMIVEYKEKKNRFNPIFSSKNKFLVHMERQVISEEYVMSQVYHVGKNYQFENGISESFTLLNMLDESVAERVNQACKR